MDPMTKGSANAAADQQLSSKSPLKLSENEDDDYSLYDAQLQRDMTRCRTVCD